MTSHQHAMKAIARASLDIFGRDLRYAEVEQLGSRYRLLRLGSCDFDFDVVAELLGNDPNASHLTSVREALRDVLSGSVASVLRFVMHPPAVRTFMAAFPGDLPRSSIRIRAHQEAALLYGVGPALSVDHEPLVEDVPAGENVAWHGVSVTLADVRKRLSRIAAALPGADVEVASCRLAAGRALERFMQVGGNDAGRQGEVLLAVGRYGSLYEIAYGTDGRWMYSHTVDTPHETDAVYFSAQILSRLNFGPDDVRRLLTFGDEEEMDLPAFSRFYGVRPQAFDPLMLVNIDPSTVEDSFQGGAFLTCVGGAL
jgi:hypothetical protein